MSTESAGAGRQENSWFRFYLRDYGSFMSIAGLGSLYAVAAHAVNRRHAWITIIVFTAFSVATFTLLDRSDGFAYSAAAAMLTSMCMAAFVGVVANRPRGPRCRGPQNECHFGAGRCGARDRANQSPSGNRTDASDRDDEPRIAERDASNTWRVAQWPSKPRRPISQSRAPALARRHRSHRCQLPRCWPLVGMRERVELYDGTLTAGPQPGGGYLVTAMIPLDSQMRRLRVAFARATDA
jgi:hypothetical protein